MKKMNSLFTALLMVLLVSSVSLAQRGGPDDDRRGDPRKGGPRDTTITKDSTNHGGPRDTTNHKDDHGGPRDTTKGGPRDTTNHGRPPKDGGRNFGLADSCFRVFLSQLPQDSAAIISNDLAQLKANKPLVDSLFRDLRRAKQAGDTAAMQAIAAQLRALKQQENTLRAEIALIIRQHIGLFDQVRKDCMGNPRGKGPGKDKGTPGNDGTKTELKMTPVTPNPVANGGTATFTYTIGANSANTQTNVLIALYDPMGTLVKNVFSGAVDAGTQTVQLDLSGLQTGIYILRVQAGNAVGSQKIMIQ